MVRPWRTSTGWPSWEREHLDGGAGGLDQRRPDEDAVERLAEPGDGQVGLEAVELAAIAVASHGEVDRAEAALVGATVEDFGRQQDHPGTRPEHGEPV